MCKFRQVQWVYQCGHKYRCNDEYVECGQKNCLFSPAHPSGSGVKCGANCKTTCWQYRQFPEQYEVNKFRNCPNCGGTA